MIFAKAVAGDYSGNTEIRIGVLWSGPKAEKFKGLHFMNEGVKYKPEQIKRVIHLSEEKTKSFLGSALTGIAGGFVLGGAGLVAGVLAGGKNTMLRLGIELNDGRKVVLEQSAGDKALQCLLLFAKASGIMEQDLGF